MQRRDQRGVSLIETLLVVALSGLLLVPILGWGILASRQHIDVKERNADSASIGLLRTYFVRDVASASTAAAGTAAAGGDCAGGEGAATEQAQTLLVLGRPESPDIVYNAAPGPAGAGTSLWRRECDAGTLVSAVEMVGRVAAGSTVVTCAPRNGFPSTDCGRIGLRLETLESEAVSMTASLRAGLDAVGQTTDPPFVSPEVVLTADQTEVYRGDTVDFDASGSSDPGGGAVSFHWEFGDGTTSTDPSPSFTFTTLGEFVVSVTVTNGDGTPASDFVRVTVRNRPPVAVLAAPDEDVTVNRCTDVSFSAVGSNDSDDEEFGGSVAEYHWTYGDGESQTRTSPAPHVHRYEDPSPSDGDDPYVVRLRVEDDDGDESESVTRNVRVRNRAPNVPVITGNGYSGSVSGSTPLTVEFAATATDPDGTCDTLTYEWDFGDGTTSTQAAPTHTYSSGTSRTVQLTVTDDTGATAVSNQLTILLNSPPIAAFSLSPTPVRVSKDVTVTNESSDAETAATALTYAWTFPHGTPATSTARAPGTVAFGHNVGGADTFISATYDVGLTVTDPDGGTHATSRSITVQGAPAPTNVRKTGDREVCTRTIIWCISWDQFNSFAWNAPTGVDRYEMEFRWETCVLWVCNWHTARVETSGTSIELREDGSPPGGTAYLRVRARDTSIQKWGAWSGETEVDIRD